MYNFLDFNLTHFLDSMVEEYRAKGFDVTYLPFFYGADFIDQAGSSTARQTVTIDHDSDFIWSGNLLAVYLTSNGDGVPFPNATVEFILNTSQRQIQNQASHVGNVCGTGQRPYTYYKPLVLPAKSSFVVENTDLSGVQRVYRYTFCGVKAFMRKL